MGQEQRKIAKNSNRIVYLKSKIGIFLEEYRV